jgi:phospholipase/lecithinase/hemolysin
MNTNKRIIAICYLAVSLLISGCGSGQLSRPTLTPTPTPIPISHVYAFGDSYSDNGKNMWDGRASNGPVAVEVLATRLNVPLNDYAVGGAKSDFDNLNGWPNTGGLGQVAQFKTELKGQSADPQALYFVMIGGNDFLEKTSVDNPALTDKVVDNITMGVTQLAQLGAKRFLVIADDAIAPLPFVTTDGYASKAVEFQTLLDSKLSDRIDKLKSQLKIEITTFDYTALDAKIRKNPSAYGLTNVTDACQPWLEVKPICATPDQYYFWDAIHPTRRVHQIFGEAWAALFGK